MLGHHSSEFARENWKYGAVLSIWDRLFGTYRAINRAQRERLVFGVRELPRRDCLKPSAMLMTPWRLARASRVLSRTELESPGARPRAQIGLSASRRRQALDAR